MQRSTKSLDRPAGPPWRTNPTCPTLTPSSMRSREWATSSLSMDWEWLLRTQHWGVTLFPRCNDTPVTAPALFCAYCDVWHVVTWRRVSASVCLWMHQTVLSSSSHPPSPPVCREPLWCPTWPLCCSTRLNGKLLTPLTLNTSWTLKGSLWGGMHLFHSLQVNGHRG